MGLREGYVTNKIFITSKRIGKGRREDALFDSFALSCGRPVPRAWLDKVRLMGKIGHWFFGIHFAIFLASKWNELMMNIDEYR